jgi:hypothetical protein
MSRLRGAPRPGTRAGRPGVVLVLTLLALVAIEAIALGVVFLATQESRVAAAHERALRARLAAEGAAAAAAVEWRPAPADLACATDADTVPVTVVLSTTDGFEATARVERLPGRWLLARAEAVDVAGVRFSTALAFASPDPTPLLGFFPAALAGTPGAAVPPGAASVTDGAGELAVLLGAAATRSVSGDLIVAPAVTDGRCDRSVPLNWGAPLDPAHACARFAPLVVVNGTTRFLGGAGQGVLVVNGQLDLMPGSSFTGAILVAGRLTVAAGAAVTGAITVLDGGTIDINGVVEHSACAVRRALLGSGAAAAYTPAPAARWLPLF